MTSATERRARGTSRGEGFAIPAYPFWSLMIIAVDVVALWGRAPTAAARTSAISRPGPVAEFLTMSAETAGPGPRSTE